MAPRPTKVLVLDDESEIRSEINEFLTSKDIQVLESARPSEAFHILAANPVDIMILDIRLPEMSGMDVLKKIRRAYPKIQVIMMSGHGKKAYCCCSPIISTIIPKNLAGIFPKSKKTSWML